MGKTPGTASNNRWQRTLFPPPLEPGSYVLRQARLAPPPLLKLHMQYEGPFRVIKMLRPDFVELHDVIKQPEPHRAPQSPSPSTLR